MAADRPNSFAQLGLHPNLLDHLSAAGITTPFPIQVATIPDAVAGRDVLGRGRTGSGKTLSFSLPLLTRLAESNKRRQPFAPRSIILVPTRELANQVNEVIMPLARSLKMFTTTIYGGVGYGGQISALRKGVDVVVACPGRLVDHIESGNVDLSQVEISVLDEADHMAELGFLQHVEKILSLTPQGTQRLLFSATLDRGIDRLVRNFLVEPVTHEVDSEQSPVDAMTHHVLHISQDDRFGVLKNLCAAPGKTLIFTRTKHGAARLTEQLMKAGVPSVELHGNLSQSARARNLSAFSTGRADTLVATDIAARGIHVDDVSLVIHADPPEEHKAYLHRSGRTARAGASGTVVTLMTDKQRRSVRALTKSAGITPITTKVDPSDPFLSELAPGERVFHEAGSLKVVNEPRTAERRDGRPHHGKPRFDRNGRGDGPRSFGDKSKRGPRKFEGGKFEGSKFESSNGTSSRGEGRNEGRGDSRGPKPAHRGGKPYGKSNGSAGKNRNQDRRQNQPR